MVENQAGRNAQHTGTFGSCIIFLWIAVVCISRKQKLEKRKPEKPSNTVSKNQHFSLAGIPGDTNRVRSLVFAEKLSATRYTSPGIFNTVHDGYRIPWNNGRHTKYHFGILILEKLNKIGNHGTRCSSEQWRKLYYNRKSTRYKTKFDVKTVGNHIMGPGERKASRYKAISIPSCQACQDKAFISWRRGRITSLGGATARKNNQNINWQNTHKIHTSEGFTGSSTQHISRASSGEQFYHRKFHLNQQIKREINKNRLLRQSHRTNQWRPHRPARAKKKRKYYTTWTVQEDDEEEGATTQDHAHTPSGHKCTSSRDANEHSIGDAAAKWGHRRGRISPLREALAHLQCKWLRSRHVDEGEEGAAAQDYVHNWKEVEKETTAGSKEESTAAAGHRGGHTTFSLLREAPASLRCKWLRSGKLPYHWLSLNMSGNQMFDHMRAGVMLIRDAHHDYTRIDVYTRLGEGGDISRLTESRSRLTGIAGWRHMRVDVRVLCMPVGTYDTYLILRHVTWYVMHETRCREWHVPIGVQGTMMCWGLYDVFMARLYAHKIALSIVSRRVRGLVWIDKLSTPWYARLYMAWGRHVVIRRGG